MIAVSRSLRRFAESQSTPTLRFSLTFRFHFHVPPSIQPQNGSFISKSSNLATDSSSFRAAHHPFDEIPQPNPNYTLFEYSRSNRNQEALNFFLGVRRSGVGLYSSSLSCVLKVCGCLFDVNVGKQVHCLCVKSGFVDAVSVGTSLIDMYMKTGCVENGRRVFDEMPERNVVSWTSLISGYGQNGICELAVGLFLRMQMEGIEANPFTFASIFGALAADGAIEKGVQIHSLVVKNGFESTTSVGNSLISMYLKTGMVKDARAVFNSMKDRDAVSWNGMIAGFVTNGLDFEAFELFYQMRLAGVKLTQMIFATVIKLCSNVKELGFSRQLHGLILREGFEYEFNIRTALIVAYSKCNEMDGAFQLFSTMQEIQNVVSWTAMICGYLQNGTKVKAANLFREMSRKSVRPNHFTYSTILTALPVVCPFQVHAQVVKSNYENSPSVGTSLLDAYIKKGKINEAAEVFRLIDEKDIIAWSAMLFGFAQVGDTEGAVKTFLLLAQEGVCPNEYTFCNVINSCSAPTAAVEQGKQFHTSSIKFGFNNALCVSSALVTMYAKRGNIESASKVFTRQRERDLVSWNSMISGYAQHGCAEGALKIFKEMQSHNLEMDGITLIGVISACTHAGLVEEGQSYFDILVKDFHIEPTMEHYSCMVDLYGRSGMFEKAMDLINGMPFPAGPNVWLTLLAACRVHLRLDLGKLAAENLISLQPQDSAAYVLLSNTYAAAGKWQERAKVRRLMEERKVKKEAGYSWIEVKNKVYSFLAGDQSHPLSNHIYFKLEELTTRLKDTGYCPDTSYVLHDVEEEHKEVILFQHSERLAIAFGLIAMTLRVPIQVVKNLRVCGDCHTFIKLTSMVEGREIIVRDSNRFHHFKGGLCSCGDYW